MKTFVITGVFKSQFSAQILDMYIIPYPKSGLGLILGTFLAEDGACIALWDLGWLEDFFLVNRLEEERFSKLSSVVMNQLISNGTLDIFFTSKLSTFD